MMDVVKGQFRRRKQSKGPRSPSNEDIHADENPRERSRQRRKSSGIAVLLRPKSATVDTTARDASIEARLKKNFTLSSTSTAYTNERRQLLAQERKAAWDEPMRKSAKPVEVLANQLLIRIREHERQNGDLFGDVPGEKLPPPHSRDMGGRFLTNKDRIVKSKVFRIAEQMPKGSHLHLHFNAEIPPEILLPHARTPVLQETMFVRSTRPLLKPDDFDDAEIMFDIFPQGTKEGSLFSPDYSYDPKAKTPAYPTWDMGAAWMRWSEFRREFPSTGVRIEGTAADHELDRAEQWACQKMIITERRAYGRQTTNGAWACFNQGTRAFKGLLSYESVYRWYIGNAIDSMIRDKVMYAELRPMLLDKSIWSDDGRRKIGHKEQMTIVCEEMKKKEAELREKGQLHLFPFGLKIIYCTPRSIPRYMMETELYDCLLLKLEFPDLICGFDLVGAEDRPNSIGYYADLLVAFKTTCKEFGVSIPFLFHAGESLLDTGGTPDPENSNLYDCVLLNAKRIGHGNAILKHPLLMQQFRERKICLEVCPISDELLHLCGNAREHTFSELLAAGLHCSLNADNPSLFRGPSVDSKSLSFEFYQVMVGDPKMTIHGWRQLAEWSIEHSCLDHNQRAQLKGTFEQEWESFCQWVVEEYGEYAIGLEHL